MKLSGGATLALFTIALVIYGSITDAAKEVILESVKSVIALKRADVERTITAAVERTAGTIYTPHGENKKNLDIRGR